MFRILDKLFALVSKGDRFSMFQVLWLQASFLVALEMRVRQITKPPKGPDGALNFHVPTSSGDGIRRGPFSEKKKTRAFGERFPNFTSKQQGGGLKVLKGFGI